MAEPTGAHAESSQGVAITVCPDGPLLVRGAVEIRDITGDLVPKRRATIALCRCGRSTIAPFCDGSHKTRTRNQDNGT